MDNFSYYGIKSKHVIESEEKGKFLIGEIRNDNDTRVYIFSLCSITNHYAKDGYWNTFAYTSETGLKTGYYFFAIKEFKHDKNGYLNIVLTKAKCFISNGKSVFKDFPDVFRFFGMSGLLSSHYTDFKVCKDFSPERSFTISNLPEHDVYDSKQLARLYFGDFINGDVSIEKLDKLLHTESSYLEWYYSEWQARVKYILQNYRKLDKYPLASKKITRYVEENYGLNIEHYLTDMYFAYDNLFLKKEIEEVGKYFSEETGEMDLLQMMESVAVYYKQKNKKKRGKK